MYLSSERSFSAHEDSILIVASSGDHHTKIAGYLVDSVMGPATAFSQEPNEAAFQRARKTALGAYEWLDLPENSMIRKTFGIAMGATTDYVTDKIVSAGEVSAAYPSTRRF